MIYLQKNHIYIYYIYILAYYITYTGSNVAYKFMIQWQSGRVEKERGIENSSRNTTVAVQRTVNNRLPSTFNTSSVSRVSMRARDVQRVGEKTIRRATEGAKARFISVTMSAGKGTRGFTKGNEVPSAEAHSWLGEDSAVSPAETRDRGRRRSVRGIKRHPRSDVAARKTGSSSSNKAPREAFVAL